MSLLSLQELGRLDFYIDSIHSRRGTMSPEEWEEAQEVIRELSMLISESDPEATLAMVKEKARAGDPWPYVEFQWGRVVTPEEYRDIRSSRGLRTRFERILCLDFFQKDIIQSVFDPSIREIWVKGNTGCGKGAGCCLSAVAYYDVFHAQVVLTRDSAENAKTVVFGECMAWWNRMRIKPDGKVGTASVSHTERHWIKILNPRASEGNVGVHGAAEGGSNSMLSGGEDLGGTVFVLADEGTAVPADKFASFYTQAHKLLVAGNPRTVAGPFREAFGKGEIADETRTFLGPRGYQRNITIDGEEIANVRLRRLEKPVAPLGGIEINGRHYRHGEAIPADDFREVSELIPGQTCLDKHQVVKSNPDPNWVRCMAHGKFPLEDPETQLFKRRSVRHGMDRWLRWQHLYRIASGELPSDPDAFWTALKRAWAVRVLEKLLPVTAWGIDPSGTGEDETWAAVGGKRGCRALHCCPNNASTVDIVDWLLNLALDTYKVDLIRDRHPIGVDMIGVGKGVGDLLKSKGCRVVEVISSARSESKEWSNERTERYATLAQRLDLAADLCKAFAEGKRIDTDGKKIMARGHAEDWCLPAIDADKLEEELYAHRKIFRQGDSFTYRLTPKDRSPDTPKTVPTIKEIIGRSPDRADAVSCLWAAMKSGPMMDIEEWVKAGAL